jgi:hypothetical protein
MRKSINAFVTAICVATFAFMATAFAAEQNADWEAQVRKTDDAYWHEFNFGSSVAVMSHLSSDVEFYHDLGGTLLGYEALAKVNAGMDNNKNRLRREIVPGTLRVFPLRRGPDIYGAIVMGEHDFFSTDSGKVIKKTGKASFTHLMLLKDGVWKIARIYSYDHQRATDAEK